MNIFNLKNNALFLSCWHERNRPVQLGCFILLLAGALFLSFLTISYGERNAEKIAENFFYVVVILQAIVLLLIGSLFVGHLARRERVNETLDFHRNSPQPVMEKILGLVFGGTWFEWLLFVVFFFIELPFVVLKSISLSGLLLFNASLMMTGLFFHTVSAGSAIMSPNKKRISPLLIIFLLLIFGGPLIAVIFASAQSIFFAHLFGITASQYINPALRNDFHGWFYTFDLPPIVLQGIIQIPLILLMIKGMKRVFSLPNSPAWAKADVIRFCAFVFFLITGFFMSHYLHFDQLAETGQSYRPYSFFTPERFLEQSASLYLFLLLAGGMYVSFFAVPSYFKRSKYMALRERKGSCRSDPFNDGATSWPTLLFYLIIGGLFLVPYIALQKIALGQAAAAFLMIGSHVLAFAGFLEFFRLGRFRTNKIFFITILIMWWVFIPWLASINSGYNLEKLGMIMVLSPFGGFLYAIGKFSVSPEVNLSFMSLGIICFIALAMWGLALQEHAAMNKKVQS